MKRKYNKYSIKGENIIYKNRSIKTTKGRNRVKNKYRKKKQGQQLENSNKYDKH